MTIIVCRGCGEQFATKWSGSRGGRRVSVWCSQACMNKHRAQLRECQACGKEFRARMIWRAGRESYRQRFCSLQCFGKAMRFDPGVCLRCGKAFQPKSRQSVFCSRKCYFQVEGPMRILGIRAREFRPDLVGLAELYLKFRQEVKETYK